MSNTNSDLHRQFEYVSTKNKEFLTQYHSFKFNVFGTNFKPLDVDHQVKFRKFSFTPSKFILQI